MLTVHSGGAFANNNAWCYIDSFLCMTDSDNEIIFKDHHISVDHTVIGGELNACSIDSLLI